MSPRAARIPVPVLRACRAGACGAAPSGLLCLSRRPRSQRPPRQSGGGSLRWATGVAANATLRSTSGQDLPMWGETPPVGGG